MDIMVFILISLVFGLVIGFQIIRSRYKQQMQLEKDSYVERYSELEKEFINYKASNEEFINKGNQFGQLNYELITARAELSAETKMLEQKKEEYKDIKEELSDKNDKLITANQKLAELEERNNMLNKSIEVNDTEVKKLREQFTLEFENIANKILDNKTEKFTLLNKTNLENLLNPLKQNINEFKIQVSEVYNKESQERFSLGKKVKELADLNQQISEEAKNLTKALKGEAKTQGQWGEMILESILERSGLRKNEQYFMEYELLTDDGSKLRSDSENKKMRPDVVIKYPDNRHVIIDSKVSLNAFTRFVATDDTEEQKREIMSHVAAIKNHIVSLSTKGYDDYDKSLDFVLMFIPSESAYMAALQEDPNLWDFAYGKRIMLISPTNLITSLKLIVDLWKREYQTKNAIEIAEQGAKLYDKFVGFIDNLKKVGINIDKAKQSYDDAYKQLCNGNGNLVGNALKLKNLGVKNKKELPQDIVENSIVIMQELSNQPFAN